jgi:ADP-heptose:LPS heptosyltransferase
MRILVLHTGNLGDVVSGMVVVHHLAARPDEVDVYVRPEHRALLRGEKHLRLIEETELGSVDYDLCIDLDSSRLSRKLTQRVRARRKVGRYASRFKRLKYSFIYDSQVPKSAHQRIVEDYRPVLAHLGGGDVPRRPHLDRVGNPVVDRLVAEFRGDRRRIVGVHFGAANPLRRMPDHLVVAWVDYFRLLNWAVVLVGTEEAEIEAIRRACDGYPHFSRLDLGELRALMSSLDLFVGTDSGPLHVAAALGIKCVGVYGPNLFSRSGPPGDNVRVIEKDFPCRPCNQNRPCPYARRCLAAITLEDLKALLPGWVDP